MKKNLLICIAFHYEPSRFKYLQQVLLEFVNNYKCTLDIIIDTNIGNLPSAYTLSNHELISLWTHTELKHPFHLTYCHRLHIEENIDNYDNFLYIEDDELLPFENYIAYLEKFKMMWPNYVPSFIRVEKKDGQEYISDVPVKQNIQELGIIEIEGRKFISFPFPINYCGMWAMPAKELKETMKDNFVRMDEGREFAASYTNWEIGKKPLIEVYEKDGKWFVDESCYSYHLPNNYALSEGPNGQIPVNAIFI